MGQGGFVSLRPSSSLCGSGLVVRPWPSSGPAKLFVDKSMFVILMAAQGPKLMFGGEID